MRKAYIKLASREFLEIMAEELAARIERGDTHNSEGYDLRDILNHVLHQIPEAPGYAVENRRHG